VNIVDHEDDDTVSFNLKDTWYFNQEESGSLTGDEILTIPHVLLLVRPVLFVFGRKKVSSAFEAEHHESI
jgi:hypothetical protein